MSSGDFVVEYFNKTTVLDGKPQGGGLSDEIDFRNLNPGRIKCW